MKKTKILEKRVKAFIVDYILTFLIILMHCWLESAFDLKDVPIIGFIYPFSAFYFVFFAMLFKDIIGGRSIGKRLMHIRVINYYGKKPLRRNLILRNLTCCVLPLEIVEFSLLSKKKQRLGDRWAKTQVVMDT